MAEKSNGQENEYVHVSVPRKSYGQRDAMGKAFMGKNGQMRVAMKMPPHVPEVQTADGPVDISNATFFVPTTAVRAWDNDPGYYSVSFPARSDDGEPWGVDFQRNEGHWENPEAQGKDRGQFIVDETVNMRVSAQDLAETMQQVREGRRAWAQERAQKREQSRDRAPEARTAAPTPEADRRTATAQSRARAADKSAPDRNVVRSA